MFVRKTGGSGRALLFAGIAAAAVAAAFVTPVRATPHGDKLKAQAVAAGSTPPNPDCSLIVPPEPLSATGLATPYRLIATDPNNGPCNETNTVQSAFVQAAIFDPATGQVSAYHPLVIDAGTKPAVAPVVPRLPANALVALWFGMNGDNLALSAESPATLRDAKCVNGTPGSVFGQVAFCNAHAFFKVANAAIASGQLKVPPLGTASDGLPCPTVRDFFVVDQDQSDNLPTLYLVTTKGLLAQYTAKNVAALKGAVTLGNPSDNRLTDVFLDGAMGCKPFMANDLGNPGQLVPAQALNELQARMEQGTPVALIPGGDPMTQFAGNDDRTKVNEYRRVVYQPVADSYSDVDTARYCRQMLRIAPQRLLNNKKVLSAFYTPDPGAANNLYNFMGQRWVASYQILNCETLIKVPDPVSVTTNADGVATATTINTTALNAALKKLVVTKSDDDSHDSASRSLSTME
jgi:hypothetical protein